MAKHALTPEAPSPAARKRRKLLIVCLCVMLALLLPVAAFYTVTLIGERRLHRDDTHISVPDGMPGVEYIADEDVVEVNGKSYTLNRNIVSILCMGVDKEDIDQNGGYGSNGQADCIFLAVIDTRTRAVRILPISRESMVDIDLYSVSGAFLGTEKLQLCLAYAYGNSAESSSQNVLTSVRRLLYGINISSYIAIDFEGIGVITDLIGGVPVTALETLPGSRNPITEGERLNLKGDLALTYLRRRGDDLEANNRRMLRQKQFLTAFATTAGNKVKSDFTRLSSYYNAITPYLSTNLSFPEIAYLASRFLTVNFGDMLQYVDVPGETVLEGEHVAFYPDETSLLKAILDLFYIPV